MHHQPLHSFHHPRYMSMFKNSKTNRSETYDVWSWSKWRFGDRRREWSSRNACYIIHHLFKKTKQNKTLTSSSLNVRDIRCGIWCYSKHRFRINTNSCVVVYQHRKAVSFSAKIRRQRRHSLLFRHSTTNSLRSFFDNQHTNVSARHILQLEFSVAQRFRQTCPTKHSHHFYSKFKQKQNEKSQNTSMFQKWKQRRLHGDVDLGDRVESAWHAESRSSVSSCCWLLIRSLFFSTNAIRFDLNSIAILMIQSNLLLNGTQIAANLHQCVPNERKQRIAIDVRCHWASFCRKKSNRANNEIIFKTRCITQCSSI